MKLFIPACGDRIKLVSPWTFALFLEHRNTKFADHRSLLKDNEKGQYNVYSGERYRSPIAIRACTLKAGSILEIDRVYIRQFSKSAEAADSDFDSITFKVIGEKHGRFWAKLADVNEIECELESTHKQRKNSVSGS